MVHSLPSILKPQTVLRFGAGGAEGVKQAGFVHDFIKAEIPFHRIIGDSTGAVNAALIKKGWGDDGADGARQALVDFWFDPELKQIMNLNHWVPRRLFDQADQSVSALTAFMCGGYKPLMEMFSGNIMLASYAGNKLLEYTEGSSEAMMRMMWESALNNPSLVSLYPDPLYHLLQKHLVDDVNLQHDEGPVVEVGAVYANTKKPYKQWFSSQPQEDELPLTIKSVRQSAGIAPYMPPIDGFVDGVYLGDANHKELPSGSRVLYTELTRKTPALSRYIRPQPSDPQRYRSLIQSYDSVVPQNYSSDIQVSHVFMGGNPDYRRLFPLPSEVPVGFVKGRHLFSCWLELGGFAVPFLEPKAAASTPSNTRWQSAPQAA